MEVADRVVVMSNGRIEQVGTPEQVYHHPINGFVYDFLGNYNEFDGWKDENGRSIWRKPILWKSRKRRFCRPVIRPDGLGVIRKLVMW